MVKKCRKFAYEYNFLVGEYQNIENAKALHYTNGLPEGPMYHIEDNFYPFEIFNNILHIVKQYPINHVPEKYDK